MAMQWTDPEKEITDPNADEKSDADVPASEDMVASQELSPPIDLPASQGGQLQILSWNCNGGDFEKLSQFIQAQQPDIVCLQEMNQEWFANKTFPCPEGYSVQSRQETTTRTLKGGILEIGGGRGAYYGILFKTVGFTLVEEIQLVSWWFDIEKGKLNPPAPEKIEDAKTRGFDARVPAFLKLAIGSTPVTVFNWHAHTKQDSIQTNSFVRLRLSTPYQEAYDNGLLILAGDLNNKLKQFGKKSRSLTAGIHLGFDHIYFHSTLHDSTIKEYEKDIQKKCKALKTATGDHTAIGGFFAY